MASSLTIQAKLDLTSSRQLMRALDGVKQGVQNRVLKAALAKQARLAAKDAKRLAPRGPTGLLKKSMGTVYRRYFGGLVWVYVVGPRKGVTGYGPLAWKGEIHQGFFNPVKYAHLAEAGRKEVRPSVKALTFVSLTGSPAGTRKRKVKGLVWTRRPVRATHGFFFMRRATDALLARKAAVVKDVLAGLQREAAKYRAKGKSMYS